MLMLTAYCASLPIQPFLATQSFLIVLIWSVYSCQIQSFLIQLLTCWMAQYWQNCKGQKIDKGLLFVLLLLMLLLTAFHTTTYHNSIPSDISYTRIHWNNLWYLLSSLALLSYCNVSGLQRDENCNKELIYYDIDIALHCNLIYSILF